MTDEASIKKFMTTLSCRLNKFHSISQNFQEEKILNHRIRMFQIQISNHKLFAVGISHTSQFPLFRVLIRKKVSILVKQIRRF